MSSARRVALVCLDRIERMGAYANIVVPAELASSGLDARDRAFVTDLVYGTTRMRAACDALIDRFVVREPEPEIRSLLRLGAYQLHFAGVAPHAGVATSVDLAPRRAQGFVNAILRKVASTPMVWPDEATRLSYPHWIVERIERELGDDALAALERMNAPAPVTVRDDGYTQDRASQWVSAAVGAQPGERVLDLCAAPGGKATALAARPGHDGAFVVAADVGTSRVSLLAGNVVRVGADAAVVRADGTRPPFHSGSFDRVLLDAPCSGLGALRRRPDARWRILPEAVDGLVSLQRELLLRSAELVRPGGVLVYSVCTLTAAESVDHAVPAGFEVDDRRPAGVWRPYRHGWRVLPHDDDTDGMVLIRYRRST